MTASTSLTDPAGGHAGVDWRARIGALPRWWPYALITLVCFAIRLPTFGNPVLEYDEQFYLLVGDRMLHGQLPYVDLWDRKPIGLFLFYAAIRLLGGNGIVQYQVVATLCVAATASFVWAIARRQAGMVPAFIAALCYVLLLNLLGGTGGQTPVLYNALTGCAAWAAFRSNDTRNPARIIALALTAMVATGIAIQFKYTPVVEGAFFGGWFVLRLWQVKAPLRAIVAAAIAMIALALLPTLAAMAWYASLGHLDLFVQTNFVSIFHRGRFPAMTRWKQWKFVIMKPIGLYFAVPVALVLRWRQQIPEKSADFWLITGWTGFALIGFGLLGDVFDSYFITALFPLCILVAPVLRPNRVGIIAGCLMILWPAILTPHYPYRTRVNQQQIHLLTEAIQPYLTRRCLYVYDGPSILYLLTNACTTSRYVYPDHLNNPIEAAALGVDPVAEEARVLDARPGVIITADQSVVARVNPATEQQVRQALAQNYVLVARVHANDRALYAWVLKDLHPGPSVIHDPRAAIPL